MARLTAAGKLGCIIVFFAVVGGGYYYAKTHGLLDHKGETTSAIDTGSSRDVVPTTSSVQPHAEEQTVPDSSSTQSNPEVSTPVPQTQQPQQDASSNRGMQFLLNQGKN